MQEFSYPPGGAGNPTEKEPSPQMKVLNKIYGDNSSLTGKEKQLLADALAIMNNDKFWKKVYDTLDGKVKITFRIEPQIEGKSSGRYYTEDKAIAFQDIVKHCLWVNSQNVVPIYTVPILRQSSEMQ